MKLSMKKIAVIVSMSVGSLAYAESDISTALGTLAGLQIESQIEQMISDIDRDALIKAFESTLAGEPAMSQEAMNETLNAEMVKIQERQKELSEAELKESQQFIEEYAKQAGVLKTENGVYYKVLKEGDGETPENVETQVTVHYVGTLRDGTTFDSSRDRGEPATFALNQVVPGWREAVSNMKVGDQWEVVIPPELGYGSAGTGPIPPNSVLIFDIELIEIVDPEAE